ncbi:MAG: hypothetical protein IPM16_10000 [Chloroflexi bacterium]|nr:hypothetical protein [Chloroflexota bacterium]
MNLITRELWHGVNNALPRHPFLWYPLRYTRPAVKRAFWVEFTPTVMLMFATFAALVLWMAYGIAPLSLVLILDTYAGVVIARGVSRAVQDARRHGLLDLMGVTTSGSIGAVWAVMTRYVRSDSLLSGLHQAAAWLHAMWLFAVSAFGGLVILTACGGDAFRFSDVGRLLYQPAMLLNGFAVFAIMMLDYIGALVAGSIVGMMIPTLGAAAADFALLSPVVLISVQVAHYALALILHAALTMVLSAVGLMSDWSSTVVFVIAFIAARELSLRGLCVMFARHMNSSVREVVTIYRRSL